MKLYNYIISVLFILFASEMQSQVFNNDYTSRKISLNRKDTTLTFFIVIGEDPIKPQINREYYWYANEMVLKNQGGYTGNLLNGEYIVQVDNSRMIEQGNFDNGLKKGEWKKWYDNGNLKEIEKWEDGMKNGKAFFFNVNGKLMKTIDYKNNMVDGLIITYYSNDTIYQKFEKGIFVPAPVKKNEPKEKVKKEKLNNDKEEANNKTIASFFKSLKGKFNKKEKKQPEENIDKPVKEKKTIKSKKENSPKDKNEKIMNDNAPM